MTTLTAEQIAMCETMIRSCDTLITEAQEAAKAPRPEFFLVAAQGQMVVMMDVLKQGIFRLTASSARSGYPFSTFARAKTAAEKWNRALTAEQIKYNCDVHAVSHAQYLDYIVQTATGVKATMTTALEGHKVS